MTKTIIPEKARIIAEEFRRNEEELERNKAEKSEQKEQEKTERIYANALERVPKYMRTCIEEIEKASKKGELHAYFQIENVDNGGGYKETHTRYAPSLLLCTDYPHKKLLNTTKNRATEKALEVVKSKLEKIGEGYSSNYGIKLRFLYTREVTENASDGFTMDYHPRRVHKHFSDNPKYFMYVDWRPKEKPKPEKKNLLRRSSD